MWNKMLQDINNTTGHVVEIGCLLEIDGTKHSQVGLRAHITADLWNEKSCLNLISHILKHSACHPLWQTSSFMHIGTGWNKPKLFVEALNRQVCILWEMCQRAICCQGLFGCFILDQTSEGVELLLIEVNPKQIMAPGGNLLLFDACSQQKCIRTNGPISFFRLHSFIWTLLVFRFNFSFRFSWYLNDQQHFRDRTIFGRCQRWMFDASYCTISILSASSC